MVKHYAYCMEHDTGFAPNVKYGICTLTGCKSRKSNGHRNIEEMAEDGSWVVGFGGMNTNQPGKMVYAMRVEKNLSVDEFKQQYPGKFRETQRMADVVGGGFGECVLLSREFYYFGDNAIDLPGHLKHIIYQHCNCRLIDDEDAVSLSEFLSKNHEYGVHGTPNQPAEGRGIDKGC